MKEYKQHNPFVADGRKAFMDFFKEDFVKNPNSSAEIKRVVAEGDTVALHVHSRTNISYQGWKDCRTLGCNSRDSK